MHTHTAKAGFIGRLAARLAGTPFIIHTPHGHNFYGYFSSLGNGLVVILERIAALFANKIVVFTNIEKKDMMRLNICKESKIDVVQSGLDLTKFSRMEIDVKTKRAEFSREPDKFLVGMIGRLESVKGPEYFVEAIRFIVDEIPQAKFLIVGEGTLKDSLALRCQRLALGDKVVFTGWREDIPEIMSVLDVLVLTSLNEAVGRVLLEAGASGKPIVATDVGGVPEILKNMKTGILVPPKDSQKIAEAVITLLKDEKARCEMGRAAKDWVNANFNEKKMADELQNLYRALLKI